MNPSLKFLDGPVSLSVLKKEKDERNRSITVYNLRIHYNDDYLERCKYRAYPTVKNMMAAKMENRMLKKSNALMLAQINVIDQRIADIELNNKSNAQAGGKWSFPQARKVVMPLYDSDSDSDEEKYEEWDQEENVARSKRHKTDSTALPQHNRVIIPLDSDSDENDDVDDEATQRNRAVKTEAVSLPQHHKVIIPLDSDSDDSDDEGE